MNTLELNAKRVTVTAVALECHDHVARRGRGGSCNLFFVYLII